jgi:hypothetical protein
MGEVYLRSETVGQASLSEQWGDWLSGLAPWEWYLTLTFRDSIHPEQADRNWQRYLKQLQIVTHRKLQWARALEYQRRGVIHFHALAAGGLDRLPYNMARQLWPHGYSWIERYIPDRGATHYLGKYVSKGGEVDIGGPLKQTTQFFGRET